MPRNTTEARKHFFGPPKMLLGLDLFSSPLPAFNIRGEDSVRTYTGGCLSLIIMYIAFLFATLKMDHLLSKYNPSVNDYVEMEALDEDDIWYGSEHDDFFMAFSIVDYVSGEVKNDPRFVKWMAQHVHTTDGEWSFREIPIRVCTDEDYKRFYEPSKTSADRIEKYKKLGGWMCFDWSTVELAGTEAGSNFRTMDIMVNPCNFDLTLSGATDARIPEDCNWDKQKYIDYMSPGEMLMYYNTGRF